IRICSKRNAPTGMIPVSECRRRSRNDVPCPARSGATPRLIVAGAAGLAVVATMTAPYEFGSEKRTFYYPGAKEGKSREGAVTETSCAVDGVGDVGASALRESQCLSFC